MKVIKEATCTQDGLERYTCTECGYSYTDEESGWYKHNYEDAVLTEPTCTKPGKRGQRCTLCGEAAPTEGAWGALNWAYVDGVLTITGEGEMPELEFISAWNDFWSDNTPLERPPRPGGRDRRGHHQCDRRPVPGPGGAAEGHSAQHPDRP